MLTPAARHLVTAGCALWALLLCDCGQRRDGETLAPAKLTSAAPAASKAARGHLRDGDDWAALDHAALSERGRQWLLTLARGYTRNLPRCGTEHASTNMRPLLLDRPLLTRAQAGVVALRRAPPSLYRSAWLTPLLRARPMSLRARATARRRLLQALRQLQTIEAVVVVEETQLVRPRVDLTTGRYHGGHGNVTMVLFLHATPRCKALASARSVKPKRTPLRAPRLAEHVATDLRQRLRRALEDSLREHLGDGFVGLR